MTTVAKESIQEFEYKAEMKQLLNLIVHSLYTHPEVFLRELISNSSDALNKVRFRELTDNKIVDAGAKLEIRINVDSKKMFFSIEDNGIGMTKEDLINNIGTVASSGTLEFFKSLKEQKKEIDGDLIGKFGVGFYSVFMVTDEVTVETKSAAADSSGYRWQSKGENKFTIDAIDKVTRGTKISFTLKEEYKEFAEEYRVKGIINKYSNFVDFPIFLGKDEVNKVDALWHHAKDSIKEEDLIEFYKYVSNDFDPPMGHLQLNIEGNVNFKALVFIPEKASPMAIMREEVKSLQLYSNKVLIQEDCKDLIPEYLRFVRGVVDTEDLPLNVSREVTQNSPVMQKIKKVLTGKILGLLDTWATSEKEKYEKFYKQFNTILKIGLNTDFSNKDKIVELLRFETSMAKAGELISLKDYVSRMRESQKDIYYLAGEHRELISQNPNLEYFKKNEIEVLFLTEPIDGFVIPTIGEYDKKALKSIDKADIDLSENKEKPLDDLRSSVSKPLIKAFKEILINEIEDVVASKRLVDSPATLVVGKQGMDPQMERMMKMMNADYTGAKKILEINLSHPLIKNLSALYDADKKNPLFKQTVLQLYDGALLIEGSLKSPTEFVKRMTSFMEKATQK